MRTKKHKVFIKNVLNRIKEKANSAIFLNLYNTLKENGLALCEKEMEAETKRAIELLYPVYLIDNSNSDDSRKKAALTIYWTAFNEVYAESKINWFNEHINKYPPYKGETITDYGKRILYEKHIRLEQVEVDKDGWLLLSNYCPALEACKILHLDTKTICKIGFTKQYQILLDKVAEHYNKYNNIVNGKKLIFSRNYSEIRSPFSTCNVCKEKVDAD